MESSFNKARVDLHALAHNLGQARALVPAETKVMAVVKADAYGHGLEGAGLALAAAGAEALGVMDVAEGARLRRAGADVPVFVLAGFRPEEARLIVAQALTPFVYDLEGAQALDQAARASGRVHEVHLKVDTGMNRLGVRFDQTSEVCARLKVLKNIRVTGLASHFVEVDPAPGSLARVQLARFEEAHRAALAAGLPIATRSMANSAALACLPESHFEMVRPGLMLYGYLSGPAPSRPLELGPVMEVASRLIQVRQVRPGEGVSYGHAWRADKPTLVGVVPLGYTHGLFRAASGRGFMLVNGAPAPILGTVCMNLTMVDLTDIPGCLPGGEAVVLGRRGENRLDAQDLARAANTIPYEILCALGARNHREYVR